MARPGPSKKVSDDRLLMEVFVSDQDVVFADQIKDEVDMETTQGVRDRLNTLCEDTEYLTKETVSGRNLYSLTDEGREHMKEQIRSAIR